MMIKNVIRVVDKLDNGTAKSKLVDCLHELKIEGLQNSRNNIKNKLIVCIAQSIVASTREEVGYEYARRNAIKRAMEFDSSVIKTMNRKCGRYGTLFVELAEGEIRDEGAFNSTIDAFVKHLVNAEFEEQQYDVFIKCALTMAELLHVCGFETIDVHVL